MGVDQAGRGEAGGEVDDLRARPFERADLFDRADRDDLAASRGDGLRPGLLRVAGPDPADLEDHVRLAVGLRPERPAGQGGEGLTFGDHGLAVDEQVADPRGVSGRVVEGRDVPEGLGVEDDEVGLRPGPDRPPIGESQDRGGQGGAGPDGLFEGDDLVVEGVADLPGEGPVGPGVGLVAAPRLVGRPVGGGRDPVEGHDLADVVLAHPEADRLGAAVALDVEDDLQRGRPLGPGDRDEVLADAARGPAISGDPDRGSAVPGVEVLLDLLAEF